MWSEIQNINSILPDNAIGGVTIMNRLSYLEDTKSRASGHKSEKNHLIAYRPYRGPEIKPLLPRYVANQMSYVDTLNPNNLSNMEILKWNKQLATGRKETAKSLNAISKR
jgi:hypothetical protein